MILTMNENLCPGTGQEVESKPPLHRLRRYPHNGFIRTSQVMTGDMLNKGNHKTTYFVLSILLLSSLPLVSNVSADQGIPEELQAQDIAAETAPTPLDLMQVTELQRHKTGALFSWSAQAGAILAQEDPAPCLLYTSPSPRDRSLSRMPSSA